MLGFNWKFLTPLALLLLIVVAILDKAMVGVDTVWYVLVMLGANLLIVWGTVLILRRYAQIERVRIAEERPEARAPEAEMGELLGQE